MSIPPPTMPVMLTVNGSSHEFKLDTRTTLLAALRIAARVFAGARPTQDNALKTQDNALKLPLVMRMLVPIAAKGRLP